ncbi:MAG: bifunctional riboflavin kinase/FAD synthetase [Ruminococcaceae bacterium]|nr:bifunctional riboflavin kinase/FAD synthetase [Oscillospiraceae bacterium]
MSEKNGGLAVALGTFDGFHIGHKMVIDKIRASEKSAVLLFNEHPQKVLTKKSPGELITETTKKELLKSWGVEPITINFGEIMSLSYEEFFYEILLKKLGATALSCGFNYRFGAKASGNTENLKELCKKEGVELFVSEAVEFNGEPVSSTRIRNSIKQGDIESANAMLGREFSYDFLVVHGDARGRTIDSPTINQFFTEDFIVPQYGVYASYSIIDGKKYPSVTNVGVRPTIEGYSKERSETNIVGFDGDLYDKNISVHLLEKIREEMKFSNLEELRAQIAKDREVSKTISKDKGIIL